MHLCVLPQSWLVQLAAVAFVLARASRCRGSRVEEEGAQQGAVRQQVHKRGAVVGQHSRAAADRRDRRGDGQHLQ